MTRTVALGSLLVLITLAMSGSPAFAQFGPPPSDQPANFSMFGMSTDPQTSLVKLNSIFATDAAAKKWKDLCVIAVAGVVPPDRMDNYPPLFKLAATCPGVKIAFDMIVGIRSDRRGGPIMRSELGEVLKRSGTLRCYPDLTW